MGRLSHEVQGLLRHVANAIKVPLLHGAVQVGTNEDGAPVDFEGNPEPADPDRFRQFHFFLNSRFGVSNVSPHDMKEQLFLCYTPHTMEHVLRTSERYVKEMGKYHLTKR